MKQRIRIMVLAVLLLLSLPVGASAAETAVAQIGSTAYDTLDEAVSAAKDGDTIVVLADCTTEKGLNLSKNLTIQAADGLTQNPTISFTEYGIALWQKSLTVKNCDMVMNGIGSTPYAQEWSWMTICGQAGSTINLEHVNLTMDGQGQNKHAIYADNGLRLYLNNSNLVIKNYGQDALEWNGGSYDYNVELINSTFLSDHNRSGFTGSFHVKAENSAIDVINSTGNGSNGSNFYFTDSWVNFSHNGSHGLSANQLESINTPITANDNGRWGIVANRVKFINCKGDSRIQANNNGYNGLRVAYAKSFAHSPSTFDVINSDLEFIHNGYWKPNDIWNGVQLKNVIGSIDADSTLTIRESPNTGLLVNGSNSAVTIEEGADVTITENNSGYLNGGGQGLGGGVRVDASCQLVLPSDAKIYNNHAELAGDDIYCADGGKITFGQVGSDWYLDDSENQYRPNAVRCADQIDGWYEDKVNEDSRYWDAHNELTDYVKEFTDFTDGLATVTGPLALKAAHGIIPEEPVKPIVPGKNIWDHSKSKTAANLDDKFESRVTLSLPSAEEPLVSDIVFVLDESSCSEPVKEAVGKMLTDLYAQVKDTDAAVQVGAVQFRGCVTEFALKELNDKTAAELTEFMGQRPTVGGSNMSASLLAGEAMLDADTEVEADRKYLILVSDGITYIWDDEKTEEQENFGVNFSNEDMPNHPMLAGPDGWDVKYGRKYKPADWSTHFDPKQIQRTLENKDSEYVRGEDISQNPFVKPNEQHAYATTVDIALYKSLLDYNSIASKYHIHAVLAGVDNEMEAYPYGPSFMKFLEGGKVLSFDDIQKDIFYLLDDGSKVVDVIGYGSDYHFDFVPEGSKLSLTVGGKALKVTQIDDTTFGFGDVNGSSDHKNYPFVLHYFEKGEDGTSDECFVWEIHVPVSSFAPVQLTYAVRLTDPKTEVGIYGKYDPDGSQNLDTLLTNKEATLYPVASDGTSGKAEQFRKPAVSYEVKESETPVIPNRPDGPDEGGGLLNKEDHFAYIIGYPEDYITGQPTNDQTRMPVKPQGKITRAEVATIYFRMLTDKARDHYWTQENSFSDVSLDDWFNNAISTMANAGIIEGYPDGTFRPNAFITRAEFATIAVRFFDVQYNGEDQFPDIDGHWAREYINKAAFIDLVEGYPDGTFGPDRQITRAEAVTLVNRTLNRHPDKNHLLPDMLRWPDNMDTTQWYYADMQEATNSHAYDWMTNHKEDWTHLREVRDWAAFEKAWSTANSAHNPGEVVNNRAR